MNQYDIDSLLYQYFGVSWKVIEFSLPTDVYYCMVAKCLDYQELDLYRRWIDLGNKASKFKWASPDHAGTQPTSTKLPAGTQAIDIRKSSAPVFEPGVGINAVEQLAQAQGREVCYIYPDGRTVGKDGLDMNKTPEHIPYYIK